MRCFGSWTPPPPCPPHVHLTSFMWWMLPGFPHLNVCWSSDSVYYCERKGRSKRGRPGTEAIIESGLGACETMDVTREVKLHSCSAVHMCKLWPFTFKYFFFSLQAVLFIYDITNYSSFENLEDWLAVVHRVCYRGEHGPPALALVGNKGKGLLGLERGFSFTTDYWPTQDWDKHLADIFNCFSHLSGFSVGSCMNEEEGYMLPTWARKITSRLFDWMLQSSSGQKWRSVNKYCYL